MRAGAKAGSSATGAASRGARPAARGPLRGHDDVLAGLWRAVRAGRLAHGLLFDGPEGVGKFRAAHELATGLLCAGGPGAPCGACGPCKRVATDQHADLHVLDPEAEGAELIAVNWIRPRRDDPDPRPQTVEHFLSLKPAEGGWRIVIVRDAERMNPNAQNALLKTLEEPRPEVLLVLVTARPERLLETVRSRVVRVSFAPLAPADALAVLAEQGLDAARAAVLARWGRCSPGRALALERSGAVEARALLERVLAGETGPLAAARAAWTLPGTFEAKTPTAAARMRARAVLDLALAVLADVERRAAGLRADELAHGDLADATLARLSAPARRSLLDEWLALRQDVDANLSPEGLLDRALLALDRALRATAGATRAAGRAGGATTANR